MSIQIQFKGAQDFEHHICEGRREGEWLIFSCPYCDYERRFNHKTGEMQVHQGIPQVLHSGLRMPVGIGFNALNTN